MNADSLVRTGRIWQEYQRVVVEQDARAWSAKRVHRVMAPRESIPTGSRFEVAMPSAIWDISAKAGRHQPPEIQTS